MTERGTTGAGESQITGIPRVYRTLEQDGCGTVESNIRLGHNGVRPGTSPATIHGSLVTNGAKLSRAGTKLRHCERLACWTPGKPKPKNRLMSGKTWKIERKNGELLEREYRRLMNDFEMGGFMAQKGLWNLVREKMLQDRGALPKEEGDVVREYKAMHE